MYGLVFCALNSITSVQKSEKRRHTLLHAITRKAVKDSTRHTRTHLTRTGVQSATQDSIIRSRDIHMLVSNGPKRLYQGKAEGGVPSSAATMPGAPLTPAVASVAASQLRTASFAFACVSLPPASRLCRSLVSSW